jgi:hypothetical protein
MTVSPVSGISTYPPVRPVQPVKRDDAPPPEKKAERTPPPEPERENPKKTHKVDIRV